ncbi:type IX secretion system sortase PorU [Flavobacterium chuncheonense]|uniref:Type IX secretion system sortase PorU n=1 Tax=Flavobacterium chuncheonense TaxID=2026653 RepID=A0ABW5YKN1_9FLAO
MKKIAIILVLLLSSMLQAQFVKDITLNWDGFKTERLNDESFVYPFFKDQSFSLNLSDKSILSSTVLPVEALFDEKTLVIENVVYQNIDDGLLYDLDKSKVSKSLNVSVNSSYARTDVYGNIVFSPIVKMGNQYKRVVSLRVKCNYRYNVNKNGNSVQQIHNSVLSSGDWYRFYVEKSGVYKVTKQFLASLGFNVNTDPRNIKIYGNGGRMLPLLNSLPYSDDLEENAIQFIGENDGVFNDSDYILFYAEGVDTWNEESLTSVNLYDDKSYYYVTSSGGAGKRIQNATIPSGSPSLTFNQYDYVYYYEKDLVNVGKLGRRWFGEQFIVNNQQNFSFTIPNIDTSVPVGLRINLASASYGNSSFNIEVNGQNLGPSVNFNALGNFGSNFGYENQKDTVVALSSSSISIDLKYNNGGVPSSNGYLDFIELKAKCNLLGFGKQFVFYNNEEQNNIGVGQYVLSNASSVEQVWDVTDITNAVSFPNNGQNSFSFKVNLGTKRKYVVVEDLDYYEPLKESNARVVNQNLKGTVFLNNQGVFQDIDYLIITPDFLKSQAERLANFHRVNSGLKVKVVTTESIYQEFSSGKQDVAAIRNFVRYVYFNASVEGVTSVKYLNLFGDASYDYKNRTSNNSNIVPIFHYFNPYSSTSNNPSNMSMTTTFCSDDFFGLVHDNEGLMLSANDGIDIAVGRMVVSSHQQASEMVDKVIDYYSLNSYGRWRNNYLAYSDDPDTQTDSILQVWLNDLVDLMVVQKPFVNVKKIHTDAYVQQVAAGGERYPEAKNEFLDAIASGALVVNYLGHGNEESLARERLFEKIDAQNLTNEHRYPLFITMTCDFTRFDDPGSISGGEYMYLNKKGGAIAMVATTRELSFPTANIMNDLFSEKLYAYGSYDYPTVSEALRLTKLQTNLINKYVISFVGDPALQLAIPNQKVVLTAVNDVPVGQSLPPFRALDLMKVQGQVVDASGNLMTNYNGDVAIQIFDKNIDRSTLGNDGQTDGSGQLITMDFETLGETIFRGNASVVNGKFEISFVVPKDIKIPLGNGKISFYAKTTNPLQDQTGYDLSIEVGGVNTNAAEDNTPPTIQLYMNDENFVSGGLTNCSPILLVKLQDENGINTASGIGHDIVAILDGDETNPYVLNDYYETDLDDYTSGKLRFPFRDLEPGIHTILVKAWDVYNNLVTAEIQFNAVCSDDGLRLERVLNYPNPFVSYTEFWFTHNMPFEPLDVQVQILTVTGKLVKTINQQVVTDGFLSRELVWDGRDDFGDKIGKGVYVYKLTVRSTTTGDTAHKYEKLVIL